jgi:phenylpyruvate tautomerase PptA (4-oxalocrotonate tautomerase family)
MPLVKITIRKGRSREEKRVLLDAVHTALVDAFEIPEGDRNQRLLEVEPDNFEFPEGKTKDYTIIDMTVFPGRSVEAKRKLYQNIVGNLQKLNIKPNDILIVLKEPPLENWGIRGGYPANEVNLGFKLDV